MDIAKILSSVLNPPFTLCSDVNIFVDGNWITIVASLSDERHQIFAGPMIVQCLKYKVSGAMETTT